MMNPLLNSIVFNGNRGQSIIPPIANSISISPMRSSTSYDRVLAYNTSTFEVTQTTVANYIGISAYPIFKSHYNDYQPVGSDTFSFWCSISGNLAPQTIVITGNKKVNIHMYGYGTFKAPSLFGNFTITATLMTDFLNPGVFDTETTSSYTKSIFVDTINLRQPIDLSGHFPLVLPNRADLNSGNGYRIKLRCNYTVDNATQINDRCTYFSVTYPTDIIV